MGRKRTASGPQAEDEKQRRTRESSWPSITWFRDPKHSARYRSLVDKRFIEQRQIDWTTLEHISLTNEVWDLISVQDWD